ncbi:MAG: hypothetical protein D6719_04615 [Candidatus Dadabacteria bacterium]|nr:MAG: hypothetical protein D6719_04615 [Candidatus Dadabacteria bacterium]
MRDKFIPCICVLLSLTTGILLNVAPLIAQEKEILGWVEKVKIYPPRLILHAKLDTGADYSSLHARNITEFKRNGQDWVSFVVVNRYGNTIRLEKEVIRHALIKRHGGKHQKRSVIRLGICVGNTYMEHDVNLVDRRNFDYQMLIGRKFLAGNIIVDPAVTYTAEPRCKIPEHVTAKKKKSSKKSVPKTSAKKPAAENKTSTNRKMGHKAK